MAKVITHLRDYSAAGARCAWVIGDSAPYGIYVDTPALIGSLAESLGFKVARRHEGALPWRPLARQRDPSSGTPERAIGGLRAVVGVVRDCRL